MQDTGAVASGGEGKRCRVALGKCWFGVVVMMQSFAAVRVFGDGDRDSGERRAGGEVADVVVVNRKNVGNAVERNSAEFGGGDGRWTMVTRKGRRSMLGRGLYAGAKC